MTTEAKKEMETQDQRIAKIKAKVEAEKAAEFDRKVIAAKKSGMSTKAIDLYTKALGEKQSLTLIPASKAPKEDEAGNVSGNHLVEVEKVDGKPIGFDGMVVVRSL